jgi:aminotransferase in exopolysaccharide biosynthesis
MYKKFVDIVREIYGSTDFIPLHEPRFIGNEKKYVLETIDSTFVSSVGKYVEKFEETVAEYTKVVFAVATVNGTAALHTTLMLAGVGRGDEVLTQSLTFAATSAAIKYCAASPVYIDVERETLGMSPDSLQEFLDQHTEMVDGVCCNRLTKAAIKVCLPMHTFGHPVRIDAISRICSEYNIILIEDAAESLGSSYNGKHTGTYGKMSILSFNGNKIISTGGGGMILTNDPDLAKSAKHLTTTAKKSHLWAYEHDAVGYNYRLPNINAALGVAQMENLRLFVDKKRRIAEVYNNWCDQYGVQFVREPANARSNYWLNALLLENSKQRDAFLQFTNQSGVMTRPAWRPMHLLPMYNSCQHSRLGVTEWVADRLVNIPSSVKMDET